jgi:hypothetical protein
VVRCGDDYGVDIFAIQRPAEIAEGVRAAAGHLAGAFGGRAENIAHGADLHLRLFLEIGQVIAAHAATADDCDADFVIGRDYPGLGRHGRGRGFAQETPSIHRMRLHPLSVSL